MGVCQCFDGFSGPACETNEYCPLLTRTDHVSNLNCQNPTTATPQPTPQSQQPSPATPPTQQPTPQPTPLGTSTGGATNVCLQPPCMFNLFVFMFV